MKADVNQPKLINTASTSSVHAVISWRGPKLAGIVLCTDMFQGMKMLEVCTYYLNDISPPRTLTVSGKLLQRIFPPLTP